VTAWLAGLPARPLRDGFVLKPAEPAVRTAWESGPARQRRFVTKLPYRAEIAWHMSQVQFELFRGWYSGTLAEGTAWFEIELPAFRSVGGAELVTCEARFVDGYRAQPRQRAAWQVASELEFFPPAVDAGDIAGLTTDWPAALPSDSVAGPYSIDPHEPTLRGDDEEGPVDKRRRFEDTPAGFAVTWRFDFDSFALFLAWWRGVLKDGQRWAQIPLRLGASVETRTCRFRGDAPWQAAPWRGAYWQVSAALEVRRPPILSEEEIEAYLAANPLHHLVHVTLPASLPGA